MPHNSSSSGVATATGTAAPAAATTAVEAAPEPTVGGTAQTPEGVPEDVLEESEEKPEMVLEPVPGVVPEEVPLEGAMIIMRAAAPSSSYGAPATSSLAPHVAAATGVTTGAVVDWRWSWGILPFMRQMTFPWMRL
jgi:hypothetical protein